MNLSTQTQAVMLLTVSFEKSRKSDAKPLSTKEWARFAVWLKDHDLEPSALLKDDLKVLLAGWLDRSITVSRLEGLLDRGGALGLALEKWQRAGLWIITRSDPEYPERLKRRLRFESPPVLFGFGNKILLSYGGIAVVGSRDADQDDIAFSENLGDAAARQGYSIVSGGARGVDESAMLGALKNKGTVIGVMADSLLRAATSAKYRKYLLADDLVLITTFNPEAGFNVGNAMSRNRYIYCLADAAVVVSSTPNRGGTWNGAIENLKAAWAPLWVKRTKCTTSGNKPLVSKGASWLPDNLTALKCLLNDIPSARIADDDSDTRPLFVDMDSAATYTQSEKDSSEELAKEAMQNNAKKTFYSLFLDYMSEITRDEALSSKDVASRLDLKKSQVDTWLKQGVSDGKIDKLGRPVRYCSATSLQKQVPLHLVSAKRCRKSFHHN